MKPVDVLYGCSMGGSVVLRLLATQKVAVKNTVCDGGITPYQMSWLITRFIAIKDFLMMSMGKIGGLGLLEKAFSTDEYSKEDLKYMANIFRFMSYKTIWRTFESCNNYDMPKHLPQYRGRFRYWYGAKEVKDRKQNIAYIKECFSHVEFIELKNTGHAGMATLHPQEMAERLKSLLSSAAIGNIDGKIVKELK